MTIHGDIGYLATGTYYYQEAVMLELVDVQMGLNSLIL